MAKQATTGASLPLGAKVFAASRGPLGRVHRESEITEEEAVARRKAGQDIVVCGPDHKANRRLARKIEATIGPSVRQDPHEKAGPYALPHYQQKSGFQGHSFYETANRRAARNQ